MKKKYILKPGRHQFAPGSPAVHTNANLSDQEMEWYLVRYPHIAALFERNEGEAEQEPGFESADIVSVSEVKNK